MYSPMMAPTMHEPIPLRMLEMIQGAQAGITTKVSVWNAFAPNKLDASIQR